MMHGLHIVLFQILNAYILVRIYDHVLLIRSMYMDELLLYLQMVLKGLMPRELFCWVIKSFVCILIYVRRTSVALPTWRYQCGVCPIIWCIIYTQSAFPSFLRFHSFLRFRKLLHLLSFRWFQCFRSSLSLIIGVFFFQIVNVIKQLHSMPLMILCNNFNDSKSSISSFCYELMNH